MYKAPLNSGTQFPPLKTLENNLKKCMTSNLGKNYRQKLNLSFAEYLPSISHI